MQLFTATFVKNKYLFLTILLQQKLALVQTRRHGGAFGG